MADEREGSPALIGLAADVLRDLAALDRCRAQIRAVLSEIGSEVPDAGQTARLAVALHQGYGAAESALMRIARLVDGDLPAGPRWHADLLERMTAPFGEYRGPVLTGESSRGLRRLLGFRHFFRHAYGVELDPVEVLARSRDAAVVLAVARDEVELFIGGL